jgi:hypothetical protein
MRHGTTNIGTPNFNPDFNNHEGVTTYFSALEAHDKTFHPVVQTILDMPHHGAFPLGTDALAITARDIARLREEDIRIKMVGGDPVVTLTIYVGKRGTTPRTLHLNMGTEPPCVKAVLTAIAQAQASK